MTKPLPDDVILGVTHLFVDGELVQLLKCPFCNFKNIHEQEIIRHIRYNEDANDHDVDVDAIDKKRYVITKSKKTSAFHYERKEDYPLPWIKCLWCDYKDKVERDLSWHFYDNHKYQLYKLEVTQQEIANDRAKDPFYFLYDSIEHNIDKALRLAKSKSARRPGES